MQTICFHPLPIPRKTNFFLFLYKFRSIVRVSIIRYLQRVRLLSEIKKREKGAEKFCVCVNSVQRVTSADATRQWNGQTNGNSE